MADEQEVTTTEEVAEQVEEQEEATASEETEEEAADDSSAEPPKPKGVQKRIDELTRNWRETERHRDYWRELALRSNQEKPQPKEDAPTVPQSRPKPTLESCDFDQERLTEELTVWTLEQTEVKRQLAERQRQAQQSRQQRGGRGGKNK